MSLSLSAEDENMRIKKDVFETFVDVLKNTAFTLADYVPKEVVIADDEVETIVVSNDKKVYVNSKFWNKISNASPEVKKFVAFHEIIHWVLGDLTLVERKNVENLALYDYVVDAAINEIARRVGMLSKSVYEERSL
ncbi:MAG: hypothetical protein QXM56_05005 [Acidilobaceae archaeon]